MTTNAPGPAGTPSTDPPPGSNSDVSPLSPEEAAAQLRQELGSPDPSNETQMNLGPPPLVGRLVGQYQLLEKIGQGGMGAVFKAKDRALDRTVAVKVIQSGPLDDPKFAERFNREARSLARLTHSNLLHVYNVGSEQELYYFAMELLVGDTLSSILRKRKRLTIEEFIPILAQLLGALHYVHRQGITHRDLKTGNIMICDGRAVLMDFGLAKDEQQSGLTSAGTVLGTPEYMSPEQAEGGETGPYTDIYSVGVIIFEALSGQVPFRGKSAMAIIRQHLETPPPLLSSFVHGLNPKLDAIVQRCMAKAPAERYPDCAALAAAICELYSTPELVQLASGETAKVTVVKRISKMRAEEAAPVQKAPPAAAPKERSTWTWVLGGFAITLLLALAIGIAIWVFGRMHAPDAGLKNGPGQKLTPAANGQEDLEIIEFKNPEVGKQKDWKVVVRVHKPDGTTSIETMDYLEVMKRLGTPWEAPSGNPPK